MINHVNGKEMNVCFVDPSANYVKVVGYGKNGTDALIAAIDQFNGVTGDDDEVNEWAETLDQYFITDDAVAEFEKNGKCNCCFSDDYNNVVERA